MTSPQEESRRAREAWDINAREWDRQMGEGNHFVDVLIWPAVERLLAPRAGQRLLDAACGNGCTSRRLAQAGAEVVAFDFSTEMIAIAHERSDGGDIDYRVLDATNRAALLELGEGTFDGALCNMAIMDLADLPPLLEATSLLLKPGGRFVFSITHPCFNNPAIIQGGEIEDREGDFVTTYSVKVSRYLTPFSQPGLAIHGQPEPHPYFHRPLQTLLGDAFAAGFVVDALEERAFPPDFEGGSTPFSWSGRFSEIPPVLIVRLKRDA